MWFRRDLRLADNPALLAACADGRRAAAVRARPALWGPAGAPPPGLPRRVAALARRARCAGGEPRLHVRPRRPGAPGRPAPPAQVGATRVHVAADYGPYGARRDDARRAGAGRARRRAGPHRVAVRRRARAGHATAVGQPYQVFTPFAGPGPSTAGGRRSTRRRRDLARRWTRPSTCPDPGRPTGSTLPEAGEAAARRRWRAFLDERVAAYDDDRDRPGVDGTSRMSVAPEVGRDPPAHDARRPRRPLPQRRRRDLPQRARPGASSTPTCSSTGRRPRASTSGPSSRGWRTTTPASAFDAWRRRAHRLPDRRRRDAPAAGEAGCTTGCG